MPGTALFISVFPLPALILTNRFSSGITDCCHGDYCCGKQNCPIFALRLANCGRMWTEAMAWPQASVRRSGDTLDGNGNPTGEWNTVLKQPAPARSGLQAASHQPLGNQPPPVVESSVAPLTDESQLPAFLAVAFKGFGWKKH